MRHILRIGGQDHAAALTGPASCRQLWLDDATLNAALSQSFGTAATLTLNNRTTHLHITNIGDRFFIHLDGDVHEVTILEPLAIHADRAGATTGLQTHAPMPGSVVAIPVAVGDFVQVGQTLVIIESMKLEVSLKATQPGRVALLGCAVGAAFDKDAVLVTLTAEELG